MNKIQEYIQTTRELVYSKKDIELEQRLIKVLNNINDFSELIELIKGNLSIKELNLIINENDKIRLLNKKGENFLFFIQTHKIVDLENVPEEMFRKNNSLGQNLLFCQHSLNTFKILFEQKLDPNQEDKKGYFPIFNVLKYSKSIEFEEIINLFDIYGFDFNKKNKNNLNFLEFIVHRYDNHESVRLAFLLKNFIIRKELEIPPVLNDLLLKKFIEINKYSNVVNPLFSYCERNIIKNNLTSDLLLLDTNIKKRI